jgi:hypothetical protein
MNPTDIAIIGGGASGVFAAIRCRECTSNASITIIEKNDRILSKVGISGGGRCNVTHAVTDIREFAEQYPRGEHVLRSILGRFGPRETVAWFADNGVKLQTEKDGRIFPASNRSRTITDCLIDKLNDGRITVIYGRELRSISRSPETKRFACSFTNGAPVECDRLLIATGGMRDGCGPALFTTLGHTVINPVPSLFTFLITDLRIAGIPGVTVEDVVVSLPKTRFSQRGSLLVTHRGVSGPAVLRLSSYAARYLHDHAYALPLSIEWCPSIHYQEFATALKVLRSSHARSMVTAQSPFPLPTRLWQSLAFAAGCTPTLRYADMSKRIVNDLAGLLHKSIFRIDGIDMNKKEFVTCGGIALDEIDPPTMQSRICKDLYFSGEVLDIDGVTGGFNLQAAWTTGWIAGSAMGGMLESTG